MSNDDLKGSILLVDDDPAILLTVHDRLETEGYTVATAASAEQALERLKEFTPQLIILDIAMPGIGGIAFLRTIREQHVGDGARVLVYTARAELEGSIEDPAPDAFLAKTIEPDVLLDKVAEMIAAAKKAAPPAGASHPSGTNARAK